MEASLTLDCLLHASWRGLAASLSEGVRKLRYLEGGAAEGGGGARGEEGGEGGGEFWTNLLPRTAT